MGPRCAGNCGARARVYDRRCEVVGRDRSRDHTRDRARAWFPPRPHPARPRRRRCSRVATRVLRVEVARRHARCRWATFVYRALRLLPCCRPDLRFVAETGTVTALSVNKLTPTLGAEVAIDLRQLRRSQLAK